MNLRRRKLSKIFHRGVMNSHPVMLHSTSSRFVLRGRYFTKTVAAFLSPSINDLIILNHWLRTLEEWAEIDEHEEKWERGESFISDASSSWTDYCGAVFNFVLVVNSRNEMMLRWDDVIAASESEHFMKSVLTSSSQSHSLSYNVPHLTFSERK